MKMGCCALIFPLEHFCSVCNPPELSRVACYIKKNQSAESEIRPQQILLDLG